MGYPGIQGSKNGYFLAKSGPFQVDWPSLEPPRFIWSGFSQKIAIFGALDAWIGAWNWQKWPQAILSHQLGCDMAHQALSRWTGLAWSHPGLFGPDLAKK